MPSSNEHITPYSAFWNFFYNTKGKQKCMDDLMWFNIIQLRPGNHKNVDKIRRISTS
jgi:hypothetical protein